MKLFKYFCLFFSFLIFSAFAKDYSSYRNIDELIQDEGGLKNVGTLALLPLYSFPAHLEKKSRTLFIDHLKKFARVEELPPNDMRGFGTGILLNLEVKPINVFGLSSPILRISLNLQAKIEIKSTKNELYGYIYSTNAFAKADSDEALLKAVADVADTFRKYYEQSNPNNQPTIFVY